MKVRFVIKEQVQAPAEVKDKDELKASLQSMIDTLDGAQLSELEKYAIELSQPGTQQVSPTLGEKKEKTNCFAAGKYKTFKGKSKCIQRTKGLSKDRADAYTASVLRDMGELPEKKK